MSLGATRRSGRPASQPDGARSYSHLIDLGLVVTTVTAVLTQAVVLWFHMIFVLLVVTALVLPLRGLAIRLAVWAVVATSLVSWDVVAHDTPSAELSEIPILTAVIVLVFLVARSREQSYAALRSSQRMVAERLEADRDSLRTQLEQSQRLDMLGRAGTRIAHDLRNVLTIVQWCATELLEDPDERYRRHGREASEATQRGIDLIDEMLAAGREHSGGRATIDVVPVVEHAVPLLRHLVPPGTRFEVRLPTSSVEILMSRTELMQILMNLLSNAVDASGDGGTIWLEVDVVDRVAPTGRSRRLATISMIDSGCGVDAAVLPTIFDPGVTTKSAEHSGLGLSTVWTIAARAGGTTEFVSTSRGSRVDIVIPPVAEFVQRRALVEVADPGARLLLEDAFSALGFVVGTDTAPNRETDDDCELDDDAVVVEDDSEHALLVIVHDHQGAEVDHNVERAGRCCVIDLARHLDDETTAITRERAAAVVRRIVDEVTLGTHAA